MKRGRMKYFNLMGTRMKADQQTRSWGTGKTGHAPSRIRGKAHIGNTEWERGIEGGKYTEPRS